MTFRELYWMAEASQRVSWNQAVAIVRAAGSAYSGKEPQLSVLVPGRFRPRFVVAKAAKLDPEQNRQLIQGLIDAAHGRR